MHCEHIFSIRISGKCARYTVDMWRYSLPLLSGILFALALYPLYLWPLALVALAPLYYFAHAGGRSKKELLVGGFITGLVFCVPLYYFTLAQLLPGFGGDFYTLVIRATSLPAVLLQSAFFGLMVLAWHSLRGRSPLFTVLVAASCYVLVERALLLIFVGYYPGSLAAAVVSLPGALAVAALGGIPLVSFLVAVASFSVAEMFMARRAGRRRALWELGVVWLVCVAVISLSQAVASPEVRDPLSVSIIQQVPSSPAEHIFGIWEGSAYKNPLLRARIEEAARGSDLVIYPHPLTKDSLEGGSAEAALGAWLSNFVPTSTSVLFWGTMLRDGRLFTEYTLWSAGRESLYQKRELYPLSDYTPWWAGLIGVEKSPETVSAGAPLPPLMVGKVSIAGLICSELHQDSYARAQGARADVLLAAGVDAFFPGPLMGEYSLAVARYRAAENGVPLIRANLFGPSALINADGSLAASLPYGKRGILRSTLEIKKIPTLYRRAGEWPVYALISLTIAVALYRRLKFPYSAGRR